MSVLRMHWASDINYMNSVFICVVSAFRCAYCYFLNPARKTRPQAPRLPEVTGDLKMSSESPVPPAAVMDGDQSVSGDNDTQGIYLLSVMVMHAIECYF